MNAFVAGFIGSPPMNLVDATVEAGGVRVGAAVIPLSGGLPARVGAPVTAGVRPEALAVASTGEGIAANVSIVEELGAEAFVHATLANGSAQATERANVIFRVESGAAPRNGEPIHLKVRDGSMLFFDAVSGERLR